MSRHRDKRAAFVLALLLVLMFVLGQARRADADRHDEPVPVAEGALVVESASADLHD